MAITQKRSQKKVSGGKYMPFGKKKKRHIGRRPANTKLEETKLKVIRTKGKNFKGRLLSAQFANVTDSKTKKTTKVKIVTVKENTANRHFVRRNIMTKGTIIDTELGKAKITSRPGQNGVVNAILI